MNTLRNYLPFLSPCICIRTDMDNKEVRLVGIDDYDVNWHVDDKCVRFEGFEMKWSAVELSIRPKLRPMSDMTNEEKAEYTRIGYYRIPGEMPMSYKQEVKAQHEAEQTLYLIRQKLDVFGMIEKKTCCFIYFKMTPE